MSPQKQIKIKDISKDTGKLTSVAVDDLMPLPADFEENEWKDIPEETRQQYACILDDHCVLPIPIPKTKEEEENLVNKFIDGMRKLFSKENNWTFLAILDMSMEHCARCNTCSDACHLFGASGKNEMYRPTFRSEGFRRS